MGGGFNHMTMDSEGRTQALQEEVGARKGVEGGGGGNEEQFRDSRETRQVFTAQ